MIVFLHFYKLSFLNDFYRMNVVIYVLYDIYFVMYILYVMYIVQNVLFLSNSNKTFLLYICFMNVFCVFWMLLCIIFLRVFF